MINPDAFWEIDNRWTEEEFWQAYFFLKSWVNAYKSKHVTVTYVLDPSSDHLWLFCICCVKKIQFIVMDLRWTSSPNRVLVFIYRTHRCVCMCVCGWSKSAVEEMLTVFGRNTRRDLMQVMESVRAQHLCSTHTFTGSTHTHCTSLKSRSHKNTSFPPESKDKNNTVQ